MNLARKLSEVAFYFLAFFTLFLLVLFLGTALLYLLP